MQTFDVDGALKAGLTHADIAQYLSERDNYDYQGATKAGLNDLDIINYLAGSETAVPERTVVGTVKDTAIDAASGLLGVLKSGVGMADVVTGNNAGEAVDLVGLQSVYDDPREASAVLEERNANPQAYQMPSEYSPARQAAEEHVNEAKGFWNTVGALVDNPSVAIGSIIQSAPMSVVGAGVARSVATKMLGAALAEKGIEAGTPAALDFASKFFAEPRIISSIVKAGAASEGAMTTGLIQEQGRGSGRGWSDTVAPAVAAGVGTGLIGWGTSKIPGLRDAEAQLATAGMAGRKTTVLDAAGNIVKTGIKEGPIEEGLQSGQEQAWTNVAMDKPAGEGVVESMALGSVVGIGQGGGMSLVSEAMDRLGKATTVDDAIKAAGDAVDSPAVTPPAAPNISRNIPGLLGKVMTPIMVEPSVDDPRMVEEWANQRESARAYNEQRNALRPSGLFGSAYAEPKSLEKVLNEISFDRNTVGPLPTAETSVLAQQQELTPAQLRAERQADLAETFSGSSVLSDAAEERLSLLERQMAGGEVGSRWQGPETTDSDGQTVPGEWDGVKSTNPEWLRTGPLKEVGKAGIATVIAKARNGEEMTNRQAAIWVEIKKAADAAYESDPETTAAREAQNIQEQHGIELQPAQPLPVGNLNVGDKVVVQGENGIPDVVTHQGYDDEGKAILKDGITVHADPWDQVNSMGVKPAPEGNSFETRMREVQQFGPKAVNQPVIIPASRVKESIKERLERRAALKGQRAQFATPQENNVPDAAAAYRLNQAERKAFPGQAKALVLRESGETAREFLARRKEGLRQRKDFAGRVDDPEMVAPAGDVLKPESKKSIHDYSNTQIAVKGEPAESIKQFGASISDAELYTDPKDDSYGRESEPHITVRYGLGTDDPSTLQALSELPPIKAKTGKVSIFETEKYDVVKVEIDSDSLREANKKVGELVDLPGETFKDYQPHATIAYVKKGEGQKYVGKMDLAGQEITVDTIELTDRNGNTHQIKLEGKDKPADQPSVEADQRADSELTGRISNDKGRISEDAKGSKTSEDKASYDDITGRISTKDRPRIAEQRTPETPGEMADSGVRSEKLPFNPENAIKLVADDITTLRVQDIDRLLNDIAPENREAMKKYIIKNHGDNQRILDEVKSVMQDLQEQDAPVKSEQTGIDETVPVIAEKPAELSASEQHFALIQSLQEGNATIEDYKAGFERIVASKDEVVAELSKLTKDTLLSRLSPYYASRYKSEKKADVVDAIYNDMVSSFTLGESYSYGMGEGSRMRAIRAIVEKRTADDLTAYAKQYEEAVNERKERLNQIVEAVKNPKTLQDFVDYLRAKMTDGMTFDEARNTLTVEQRASFDQQAAEKSRGERQARTDQQKTNVRTTAVQTTGEITETKHTKTGEDLFVVRAAERVERDVYNEWNATAKRMGGYYSSYRGGGAFPGFQFKTRENAEAFAAFLTGDTEQASAVIKERRSVYEDNKEQSAVERLNTMADALEARADESLGRERAANTARRARMAASAEAAAESDKALAKTMRNIAKGIESGAVQFLDRVRQKVQVEMLRSFVSSAQYRKIAEKYPAYIDQERRKGERPDAETADYAEFPSYRAFRSDLAKLGRQLVETEGTKKLGSDLLKVADDVTDVYLKFAKENTSKVAVFSLKGGGIASFATKKEAEGAISRAGYNGKAIVFPLKRNQNLIILSPSAAKEAGVWKGDDDKRITLKKEFGRELVEKAERKKVDVPWYFSTVKEQQARLEKMGIETPAEFRAALREFIGLQAAPAQEDKIKKMEREMIGRANDGLDFFPTPEHIAQQMVDVADIQEGMSVLEPSAGMGHIAEMIRAAGVDPDVVEMSSSRQELLEAKGFRVVGQDFTEINPRGFFTFGDVFRSPDGTVGIMRGLGGMGSNRVRLQPLDESGQPDERTSRYVDRDSLEGVEKRGYASGYDRIIMNPPFSKRRDVEHVRHAYSLLKPGGRLVAIMGEGSFFGSDKTATEFREWLDSVGGTSEKLEDGTFQDKSLPVNTGVNARLVVIEKSADAKYSTAATPIPPSQRADIEGELSASLGKLRARMLISRGTVKIVDSQEEMRAVIDGVRSSVKYSQSGQIQGAFVGGQVYLVRDGLAKGQAMPTLLHELGEHAKQLGFSKDAEYQRILQSLKMQKSASSKTGEAIRSAMARAEKAGTLPEHFWSEIAAYIVEENATIEVGLIGRVVNFFKKWLFKVGKLSADAFTPADLVLFARSAVNSASGLSVIDGVKLSIGNKITEVRDGFWKNFRERGRRPYGDSELIAAYSGEDRARYAREGLVIFRPKGENLGLDVVQWGEDLAGEYGYVSVAGATADGSFIVSFLPSDAAMDIKNLYDRKFLNDNAINIITLSPLGDNTYEIGVSGIKEGSSADKMLRGKGRATPLPQEGYVKANLTQPIQDTLSMLREAVRRLAIHTGEVPRIVFPRRDTGVTAGISKGRVFEPEQIEAKFSKTRIQYSKGFFVDGNGDRSRDIIETYPSGPIQYSVSNQDPSPADAKKVQSQVEGKTLLDVARWVRDTSSREDYRLIAGKVLNKLTTAKAKGFDLSFTVNHTGDQVSPEQYRYRGICETKGNSISVSINGADVKGKVGTSYEIILHELVHAATAQTIVDANNKNASPALKAIGKELKDILGAVATRFNERLASGVELTSFEQGAVSGGHNAFTDQHEALAWAFTNPDMQEFLEQTPYTKSASAWDSFVAAIKRILGLKDNTALDALLRVGRDIIDTDPYLYDPLDSLNKKMGVKNKVLAPIGTIINYSVSNAAHAVDERNPPPVDGTTVEDPYEIIRKTKANSGGSAKRSAVRAVNNILGGIDKFLGAISTRLKNISPKLEAAIRRLDFNIGTRMAADINGVEPLLKKARMVMGKGDYIDWDYARKNSDVKKIEQLVKKYKLEKEYKAYRDVLNRLFASANDVGVSVGWIDEYAPRVLKDAQGFLNHLGRGDQWPVISRKLAEVARKMGITEAEMSPEMKADIVSNMLFSGYHGTGKPGNAKERTIKMIPPELNQYYMDSDAALMHYIYNMRKHIEARRFFGKVPEKISEAKRQMNAAIKRLAEEKSKEIPNEKRIEAIQENITDYRAILDRYKNQRDYSENIAQYVIDLMNQGEISPEDERDLIDIFTARFNERGTRGFIQTYKNLSYLDTMGSPISAITQIGDFAWTVYANGWVRSIKALSKAAIGKSRITKEDVGIERIAQEFADSDTLSNAVAKVFRWVGLEKMDTIGKESLLNAALEKYQDEAKKDREKLKKSILPIFGHEADQVIDDLLADKISENVKLLVYSRLLDFQPAAMSEMSEQYLRAGNGRLFYMLKSYTLKQFDVYRREVYNVFKNGTVKEKLAALQNMAALSMLLVLANGGADELKDWILGRKTDLSDRVVDNVLRLFGVSKYLTWKARTEGYGSALVKQILPPFKFVDSLSKDIMSAGDGKGLHLTDSIPLVGKLAYWHMGRGVNARRDLWEIRFSREKKRLEEIKDRVESSPESMMEYKPELSRLNTLRKTQAKANKIQARINQMRRSGERTGVDYSEQIKAAQNSRIEVLRRPLKSLDR